MKGSRFLDCLYFNSTPFSTTEWPSTQNRQQKMSERDSCQQLHLIQRTTSKLHYIFYSILSIRRKIFLHTRVRLRWGFSQKSLCNWNKKAISDLLHRLQLPGTAGKSPWNTGICYKFMFTAQQTLGLASCISKTAHGYSFSQKSASMQIVSDK